MKKNKTEKTNAMRLLDSKGITYGELSYETETAVSGVEVARMLSLEVGRVFKTLVTTGKSGNHYVFMVPVAQELNLKKAASLVGEKSIEMLKSKELLGLTGYVHGGCSPIGMKKPFRTVIHETAASYETIFFSAGRIGQQLELSLEKLSQAVSVEVGDIIV